MTRIDILNALARKIGAKSYLEIGVQTGVCFDQIQVANKVGVDPDGTSRATHHCTSDQYFATIEKDRRFDLCFVDGLHLAEQVYRDVKNCMAHLAAGGAIVVHDCDPPTWNAGSREQCGGVWCGDVWNGWMELRRELTAIEVFTATVNTDLGCGLIIPWMPRLQPVCIPDVTERSWAEFQHSRAEWLGLISNEDFKRLMEE